MEPTLPATTYPAQPRQARRTPLNTIIEEGNKLSDRSDTSDTDEGTIIGRPSALDEKLFVALSRDRRTPSIHEDLLPDELSEEWRRRPPEFDDMYDVSDVDTEFSDSTPSLRDSNSSRPTSFGTDSTRCSMASTRSTRNRYPTLNIPSSTSLSMLPNAHKSSPLAPSPPPKIPVSPALLELLPSLVPALNATPSLDGSSCTSEHVSNISAPVTPDMHNQNRVGDNWGRAPLRMQTESEIPEEAISDVDVQSEVSIVIDHLEDWQNVLDSFPMLTQEMSQHRSSPGSGDTVREAGTMTPSDHGVELPEEALDTLRHLSGQPNARSLSPSTERSDHEMREVSNPPSRPRSADGVTPASELSSYSFSKLSVPSPGGFFSSLDAGDANPWATKSRGPSAPTSAIAERFYNLPWDQSTDRVLEQIVEVTERLTDGPPTARQSEFPTAIHDAHNQFPDDDCEGEPLRGEYEESYETELLENATANLDRTSVWLANQTMNLEMLKQGPDGKDSSNDSERASVITERQEQETGSDTNVRKTVRFDQNPVMDIDFAIQPSKRESLFHDGFQFILEHRTRRDAFLHRAARFDAIQAARLATTDLQVKALLGKYEVVEPSRPKYSGPFSQNPRATGLFETPAQIAFMTVERERIVLDQLLPVSWVIDAIKYLNGGHLLTSPVKQRLRKAPFPLNDPRCQGANRFRVLDLGGQGSCDWAWHCSARYKNVKVYTVATKQQVINAELNGPPNHRIISVPRLWQLPFKNGYFDVISARSLHAHLRSEMNVNGSTCELDMTLRECRRILKPGGYLEYTLMDSAIARAGPRASALSVEFGFNLRLRGYDPEPIKSFAPRLRQAKFVNNKSAWLFLPVGSEPPDKKELRETPFPQCPSVSDLANYEAVQGPVGCTSDAANICGLLGGWMWEQWMIKLKSEMGKEQHKWLEGVSDAIEEGRNCNAGYKMLTGWAQKPRRRRRCRHEPGRI